MNIILGNGVTAYVLAACFEYTKEPFEIYGPINKKIVAPSILLLKCKDMEEAEKYLKIFNVPISEVNLLVKTIRVGYYYDGSIHSTITEKAKDDYLAKQGRFSTTSSMSDGSSNFLAIDLSKYISKLISKYPVKPIEMYKESKDDIIYDTMDSLKLIDNVSHLEYLVENTKFDTEDYDYVYDCSYSNVKRYTKDYIEYIEEPEEKHTVITNYYSSPKIYLHDNRIIIGRYATKTQLKQKDVIDYVIFGKGNVEHV